MVLILAADVPLDNVVPRGGVVAVLGQIGLFPDQVEQGLGVLEGSNVPGDHEVVIARRPPHVARPRRPPLANVA